MRGFGTRLAISLLVSAALSGCNRIGPTSAGTHDGEFATPITVTATSSRPPAVGQEATLDFGVSASRAYAGARIDVELPPNLEFVGTPQGMQVIAGTSSDNGQPASHAIARRALVEGVLVDFRATVRAISVGPAQIRVRVTAKIEGGVDAGSDDVFLTVGATEADSHFGIDVPSTGSVTPAP